jgi:hypothetical protein
VRSSRPVVGRPGEGVANEAIVDRFVHRAGSSLLRITAEHWPSAMQHRARLSHEEGDRVLYGHCIGDVLAVYWQCRYKAYEGVSATRERG